jgi:ammonium transporter Rh
MPGIFGGLAAAVAVPRAAKPELYGIVSTLVLALSSGLVCGVILKITGRKKDLYQDKEEFSVPA